MLLVVYSWYLSYPVSVYSGKDYVYNHISIFYWIGLPLIIISLYLLAYKFENIYLKWIFSVGIIFSFYSISFFYSTLPTSDSQYFRGLNEYFFETGNLDPSQPNHIYYQWPGFFILSRIATSVLGLPLVTYEFLLYAVIGFVLATTLFLYISKVFKKNAFLSLPLFFSSLFYFLNYQCVPFSLAICFLLLLIILDSSKENNSWLVVKLVLFVGTAIVHAFVPLFFIIYLLLRYLIDKNPSRGNLLLTTSIVFLLVQFTLGQYSLGTNIIKIITTPSDYTQIASATLAVSSESIDVFFQFFSRIVTLGSALMCGIGFVFWVINKKIRSNDVALLLTGIIYSGLGIFLDSLGERALFLSFIPISLGIPYLFEKKLGKNFKRIMVILIIVILILFPFIPLHQSFTDSVHFQSQETYNADNFLIEKYDWQKYGYVFADFRVITYLLPRLKLNTALTSDLEQGKQASTIFYTVGLGKDLSSRNYTMIELTEGKKFNRIYNNGLSYVLMAFE